MGMYHLNYYHDFILFTDTMETDISNMFLPSIGKITDKKRHKCKQNAKEVGLFFKWCEQPMSG